MAVARRRGLVPFFVGVFQRAMPDPFAIAIALTCLVGLLAMALAPHGDAATILAGWYEGAFKIVGFAFQMILILVSGHALANAPPVRGLLRRLVSNVQTPRHAMVLVFAVVSVAAYLNWGLGLVVGAFLAREIAARMRADFGWLVAGAYSAWSICNSGLSSSVALSQASHGSALNIVEKVTGHLLPLSQTIFTPFTLIPTVLVVLVMCAIFVAVCPDDADAVPLVIDDTPFVDPHHMPERAGSFAWRVENSVIGTAFIVLLGAAAIGLEWRKTGISLDLNILILIFLLLGLALQKRPIAYVHAVQEAARQTGSIVLQFPFYGGIMGIMQATGLAALISRFFVSIATAHTLPVWSYLSSIIITFLVPSAGGHWAVQGPFVVSATLDLHASLPATAMAVALAENVANMLQPFWAVPIVAIAGVGIQRVMGYTLITFVVSFFIYGAAMLWLT